MGIFFQLACISSGLVSVKEIVFMKITFSELSDMIAGCLFGVVLQIVILLIGLSWEGIDLGAKGFDSRTLERRSEIFSYFSCIQTIFLATTTSIIRMFREEVGWKNAIILNGTSLVNFLVFILCCWVVDPRNKRKRPPRNAEHARNMLKGKKNVELIKVKKFERCKSNLDHAPTEYNCLEHLLDPEGNFLKQVEARTDCCVLIRGHGSMQDSNLEKMMSRKPGYEHLDEPLHILVGAKLPPETIDARLWEACQILHDLLRPMDFFVKQ
ncbi:hypothetical protein GIB67_030623 [Kingdonia uniflora]|uniref:KHDC4/BBP-like KH-domain type I domain-containing protein n=1 Tax=Kingdonia uniflora TaxID=39325 RepID=A0A7J7LM73_9MAGN|nr:hypothetical protein GIB67_030623 [Kingdonia uniflora]